MVEETTLRIIAVLLRLPAGKVASYGTIAALAGLANGGRQVACCTHAPKHGAFPGTECCERTGPSLSLPAAASSFRRHFWNRRESRCLCMVKSISNVSVGRAPVIRTYEAPALHRVCNRAFPDSPRNRLARPPNPRPE